MEPVDLILDAVFLLLGITGMVFVIVKRKLFDIWMSLLTCSAWVLKGVRLLYFDWHMITLEIMRNAGRVNDAFPFVQKAHLILTGIDTLVNLFLLAALGRLVMLGLFRRWYKKAIKSLDR